MSYVKAIRWFKENFADEIHRQVIGTQYDIDLICAIALKETSCKWMNWIDHYTTAEILQCCVFDASGDFPGTYRMAFPQNKFQFQNKYGIALTEELISDANAMRAMPQNAKGENYKPADYLYKGYGIFQYDLQNIEQDETFFTEKLWYNFSDCLDRFIKIMDEKAVAHNDLYSLIKAYNGNGKKAEQYANDVTAFIKVSKTV